MSSTVSWAPSNQHLKLLSLILSGVEDTTLTYHGTGMVSYAVMLCLTSYMNMSLPLFPPMEMGSNFPNVLGDDQPRPQFKPFL